MLLSHLHLCLCLCQSPPVSLLLLLKYPTRSSLYLYLVSLFLDIELWDVVVTGRLYLPTSTECFCLCLIDLLVIAKKKMRGGVHVTHGTPRIITP